jgi:hypothetical protein
MTDKTTRRSDTGFGLPEICGLIGLAISLAIFYFAYAEADRTWLLALGYALLGALPGVLVGVLIERARAGRTGGPKSR